MRMLCELLLALNEASTRAYLRCRRSWEKTEGLTPTRNREARAPARAPQGTRSRWTRAGGRLGATVTLDRPPVSLGVGDRLARAVMGIPPVGRNDTSGDFRCPPVTRSLLETVPRSPLATTALH